MKIDLHVHTSERSPCATVSEHNQILAAIQAGLEGIAITDHDRLVPQARLRELNSHFAPFKIFTGIEVQSEDHHWLVIGIHDQALERMGWAYPDLHRFVQERGGVIILAHPFRYKPEIKVDIEHFPPDGIEVKSTNTPTQHASDIETLAARLGITLFCNSDAHHPGAIGRFCTLLPQPAHDDGELVGTLRGLKSRRLLFF